MQKMRKGISSVIAVILLLLITISIVGMSFVFLTQTQQSVQTSTETSLEQQTSQIGTLFSVDGADRNRVYVRNRGTSELTGLLFYVNNVAVGYAGPGQHNASEVATYFLNDSQLATLPDPATLRVTSAGFSDETAADFYGRYTAAYWKFDEGSGITAADSAAGHTGVLTNGPVWTTGQIGGAIKFDGVNDFVNMTDVVDITGAQPYTLQAWVKTPAAMTVNGMILSKESAAPENGYLLALQAGLGRFSTERWAAGVPISATGTSTLAANTWYFVTVTYDGSVLRLYINGRQDAISSPSSAGIADTTTHFNVGARRSASDFSDATIDEVRVLSVARSMTAA